MANFFWDINDHCQIVMPTFLLSKRLGGPGLRTKQTTLFLKILPPCVSFGIKICNKEEYFEKIKSWFICSKVKLLICSLHCGVLHVEERDGSALHGHQQSIVEGVPSKGSMVINLFIRMLSNLVFMHNECLVTYYMERYFCNVNFKFSKK